MLTTLSEGQPRAIAIIPSSVILELL